MGQKEGVLQWQLCRNINHEYDALFPFVVVYGLSTSYAQLRLGLVNAICLCIPNTKVWSFLALVSFLFQMYDDDARPIVLSERCPPALMFFLWMLRAGGTLGSGFCDHVLGMPDSGGCCVTCMVAVAGLWEAVTCAAVEMADLQARTVFGACV